MKKIISFALVACILLSIVPMASATRDYTQGTQVVYTSSGTESYTITVPALLAPGGDGTVTLSGTWAENRIVTVTAESTVTLKNNIKETDTKTLNVNFDGISEAGSNTGSQTFTESVSVDDITNALFGTWSGKFNYNVEISNVASEAGCDTLYWDGNTDGLVVFDMGNKMYKVSDAVPTMDDLANGVGLKGVVNDAYYEITTEYIKEVIPGLIMIEDTEVAIISESLAGKEIEGIIFPEAGVYYFANYEGYTIYLTIPGYAGFQHSENCGH